MGTAISPPGACDEKVAAALAAKKQLDVAYKNFVAAKANVDAGAWGSGAGVLTLLGCAIASTTGIGAVVCVVVGGTTVVSGGLWTASGIPALQSAREAVDEAYDATKAAIKLACKCIAEHSVSTPD
jgi:hypothetical protein